MSTFVVLRRLCVRFRHRAQSPLRHGSASLPDLDTVADSPTSVQLPAVSLVTDNEHDLSRLADDGCPLHEEADNG